MCRNLEKLERSEMDSCCDLPTTLSEVCNGGSNDLEISIEVVL